MSYYRRNRDKSQAEQYRELPQETREKLEKELPRKEVTQERDVSSVYTFTKVIAEAEEFAKQWGKTLADVQQHHNYYEDYGSYSSEIKLEVKGLETDDQYYSRLWETHHATLTREEWERKEFERLKAKYQ